MAVLGGESHAETHGSKTRRPGVIRMGIIMGFQPPQVGIWGPYNYDEIIIYNKIYICVPNYLLHPQSSIQLPFQMPKFWR